MPDHVNINDKTREKIVNLFAHIKNADMKKKDLERQLNDLCDTYLDSQNQSGEEYELSNDIKTFVKKGE